MRKIYRNRIVALENNLSMLQLKLNSLERTIDGGFAYVGLRQDVCNIWDLIYGLLEFLQLEVTPSRQCATLRKKGRSKKETL